MLLYFGGLVVVTFRCVTFVFQVRKISKAIYEGRE